MDWREHIERNPAVMVGKPVIKGTRLTVELILNALSGGYTHEDLLREYPRLTEEGILACLAYATEQVAIRTELDLDAVADLR